MATFRRIDRKHIIIRRAEANLCLHHLLHHSATLTACSAVELFLEFLVTNLYEELRQRRGRHAKSLLGNVREEERRIKTSMNYWGLNSWVDFYRRSQILDKLQSQFNYRLERLNLSTLKDANEIWNRCKHDPYLATGEIANQTVGLLNDYLKEADINPEGNLRQQISVGEMSDHWLGNWEEPLAVWVASNQNAPQTMVLMYLVPFLDLIIRLIDDNRVAYKHRAPLMVAANYVFSSIDLIPEDSDNGEVSALVDDGAVLALSLFWLLQLNDFDNEIANSHWPGGASIFDEVSTLKHHLWENHDTLFPDSRGQFGFMLVWKVIERIAVDGPEALWQNYWKEQSVS